MSVSYINKWHVLAAAIVLQLAAGLGYSFSLYSDDLKRHFDYSQEQVQGIGSAINLGGYLSIISGLVYDCTAHHHGWGPRFTISLAAVLNLAGYMTLWAAITGQVPCFTWKTLSVKFGLVVAVPAPT